MQTIPKTKRTPTKISLAYCPNSNHAILFSPGNGAINKFEKQFGHCFAIGSCADRYPKNAKDIGLFWMVHFHHAVVRDGVDAKTLHKVLLEIPEYRDLCADDVPGISKYFEEDERGENWNE